MNYSNRSLKNTVVLLSRYAQSAQVCKLYVWLVVISCFRVVVMEPSNGGYSMLRIKRDDRSDV